MNIDALQGEEETKEERRGGDGKEWGNSSGSREGTLGVGGSVKEIATS